MAEPVLYAVLALIIGTLGAIVYSLRILVLMERRVANIEEHMDTLIHKILREEDEELKILRKRKKRK